MRHTRVAVVGVGEIGRRHCAILTELEDVELVAVCDPSFDVHTEATQYNGAHVFLTLDDLLAYNNFDVAIVCTPSGLHAVQTLEIAKHNKAVILEKPMATTLQSAGELVVANEERGSLISVIHQYRFHPAVRRIGEHIAAGDLGKIVFARASLHWHRDLKYFEHADGWRSGVTPSGGGALLNQGIHAVDLLMFLLGDVVGVSAHISHHDPTIEVEDGAIGLIRFSSGAVGVVEALTAAPFNDPFSLEIVGDLGVAKMTGVDFSIRSAESNYEEQFFKSPLDMKFGLHRSQLKDALESIAAGRTPQVAPREAMRSLEIVHSMYAAARQGTAVPALASSA